MRAVPLGPSVAIPAHLVAGLAKLARIGAAEVRRRDGAPIVGDLGELIADLERISSVPFPQTAVSPEISGNASKMVDVAFTAASLDVGERRVRQLITTGSLPGVKRGRDWQIDQADVERLKKERGAA